MVRVGVYTAHQLIRVDGRHTSGENIWKHKRNVYLWLRMDNRTQFIIWSALGKPIQESGAASLSAIAVVLPDTSFSVVSFWSNQWDSRRRTIYHAILNWTAAKSLTFLNVKCGSVPDQLFCNMSVRLLCELAARSICHSNRYIHISWWDYQGYTFPPFGLVGTSKCLQVINW